MSSTKKIYKPVTATDKFVRWEKHGDKDCAIFLCGVARPRYIAFWCEEELAAKLKEALVPGIAYEYVSDVVYDVCSSKLVAVTGIA